jgi:chemotaxis protein methyltransferase CheR
MRESDCVALLQWALPRLELRWEGFRRVKGQVCKRIGRRIGELGLDGASAYRRLLEEKPEEWRVLDAFCRVSISRFWRDREVFERLGSILEERARRAGPAPRVWSCGCASGEEPYSVALLFELRVRPRVEGARLKIVATDADPVLLERARRARYPPGTLRELPPDLRERGFETAGEEQSLRPEMRESVELRCEDVRERMPEGPFAVILCRNVVFTYFEPPLQRKLLAQMLERLEEGGALIVGAHERLPDGLLERESPGHPIYRRAPLPSAPAAR